MLGDGIMDLRLIEGDVLGGLGMIQDECIDTIITSPPYWGLRDYGQETNIIWDGDLECEHKFGGEHITRLRTSVGPNAVVGSNRNEYQPRQITHGKFCSRCGAWYGQLGLEPTLDLYLNHLLQIIAELKRVLKKTGVLFWNHGDSYNGNKTGSTHAKFSSHVKESQEGLIKVPEKTISVKSMVMQNERLVMRMVDEQGWILRNRIIWDKPNNMPSSVKDRFTTSYEPVYMLTKNKRYYFDLDAVRVPHKGTGGGAGFGANALLQSRDRDAREHPSGKNPGDVWHIPTSPFPEAHFAVFPEKLVEPMIKSSCPAEICKKCGKARERIIEKEVSSMSGSGKSGNVPVGKHSRSVQALSGDYDIRMGPVINYKTIGWSDCGCGVGFRPGVILDPFLGSGTTMKVAREFRWSCTGIEISPKYIQMIKRRVGWGSTVGDINFIHEKVREAEE